MRIRKVGVPIALAIALLPVLTGKESDAQPAPAITVDKARIGCLDIQRDGNLTPFVASACNNKRTCVYKAPTENEYKKHGVQAATRSFCSQGMEVTYHCNNDPKPRVVNVPGDAWDHDPATLHCEASPPQAKGPEDITIVRARIGCLDIQTDGNLTRQVQEACQGRRSCSYKAPTEDQYKAMGVHAATRTFCTQGMDVTYRCGTNDLQTVSVPGDAWNHPPAQIFCGTVASDEQTLSDLPDEPCGQDWPGKYFVTPKEMLDWSKVEADTFPVLNHPPPPATPDMYNTASGRVGSPGSTIGSVEGRLVPALRAIAQKQDPMFALCESAHAFANSKAGNPQRMTGVEWGKAYADLAVTGRNAFFKFKASPPQVASLKARCAGPSDADLAKTLDRAYLVADAIRVNGHGPQPSSARRSLGWIAVSGEDDKPLRPVNVPTAPFPQHEVDVDTNGIAGPVRSVHTRYMIAEARPSRASAPPSPTPGSTTTRPGHEASHINSPGHALMVRPAPTLAPDAEVILFIHGMDSRVEEALNLTGALHKLAAERGGKNWTVISMDLPTQGYADSLDHNIFGSVDRMGCHRTPMVDFYESFIIRFVDAVDRELGGQLKGKIRAIVGGSLGGNMALRLGRHNWLPGAHPEPWIRAVVPWSPAAIWPPMTNRPGVTAGCDNGWDAKFDIALDWGRGMSNKKEANNDRRNFFYGGFDYGPPGQKPQAQYWWRDGWGGNDGKFGVCKTAAMVGARIDRHETYDPRFRPWHWRLGIEQLAFSHRQNQGPDETRKALSDPLFLYNRTPTLLISGEKDIGGDLGKWAHDTAPLMKNTPGMFRWLGNTGHSLDDERPMWVAKEMLKFLGEYR